MKFSLRVFALDWKVIWKVIWKLASKSVSISFWACAAVLLCTGNSVAQTVDVPADQPTTGIESSADANAAPGKSESRFAEAVLVEKPVWEFGFGAGYFDGHDYPASKDPNAVGLLLPFFIYRSEVVRVAGGGGLGAIALEKPRLKVDVSIGGSFNAESSGNLARESMPDLDFLFELGPRLNFLVARQLHASGGSSAVRWLSSARGVISTDFQSLDSRGILLSTEVEWQRNNLFGSAFDVRAALGAQWASRRTHDYFYTVTSDYATPIRPQYKSTGGYLGAKAQLGFGYRATPAIRIFAAINLENFAGAANEDSPLFETDNSVGFAAALVWTLRSSKRKIAIYDDE